MISDCSKQIIINIYLAQEKPHRLVSLLFRSFIFQTFQFLLFPFSLTLNSHSHPTKFEFDTHHPMDKKIHKPVKKSVIAKKNHNHPIKINKIQKKRNPNPEEKPSKKKQSGLRDSNAKLNFFSNHTSVDRTNWYNGNKTNLKIYYFSYVIIFAINF